MIKPRIYWDECEERWDYRFDFSGATLWDQIGYFLFTKSSELEAYREAGKFCRRLNKKLKEKQNEQ